MQLLVFRQLFGPNFATSKYQSFGRQTNGCRCPSSLGLHLWSDDDFLTWPRPGDVPVGISPQKATFYLKGFRHLTDDHAEFMGLPSLNAIFWASTSLPLEEAVLIVSDHMFTQSNDEVSRKR